MLEEGQVIEGYTIIKTLGSGGMSQVYLAGDNKDIFYAIKELAVFSSAIEKDVALKSFYKEINILKSINHPGLPHLYEHFIYKDRLYMVMEYIEGQTLDEKLSSLKGMLSEKDILTWAIQLCEIFFYLHTIEPEPVIYRDIKPSNVIITKYNRARLIDFGIARRYDSLKDSDTYRLGTPGYAAPEQFKEHSQSNPKTDIYALGVLLHQLFTGYDPTLTPFKLPPVRTIKPCVSREIEEIIEKAIQLDEKDRYEGMYEFRQKLSDYYRNKFGKFMCSYNEEDFLLLDGFEIKRDITKKISPPPRNINHLMYFQVILYNASSVFLILGILWFIALCYYSDNLYEIRLFRAPVQTVEGRVISCTDEREDKGIYCHEVTYIFNTAYGNKSFKNTSYRNDGTYRSYKKEGDKVIVEYLKDDPSISRIRGMKLYKIHNGTLFVFFSVIFCILILVCIITSHNNLYLVKYGKSGNGILKNKTTGKSPYLSFILITDKGKIHKDIRISNSYIDNYNIYDRVTLLYDPDNKNRAEILQEIPLQVDDSGNFCPDRTFMGYFTLIAPFFPFFIVLLYIYYAYF